jgi:hypothetical protein
VAFITPGNLNQKIQKTVCDVLANERYFASKTKNGPTQESYSTSMGRNSEYRMEKAPSKRRLPGENNQSGTETENTS